MPPPAQPTHTSPSPHLPNSPEATPGNKDQGFFFFFFFLRIGRRELAKMLRLDGSLQDTEARSQPGCEKLNQGTIYRGMGRTRETHTGSGGSRGSCDHLASAELCPSFVAFVPSIDGSPLDTQFYILLLTFNNMLCRAASFFL